MLTPSAPCYLLIPNERNERLLARGVVQQLVDNSVRALFEEPLEFKAGDETTIFAEYRGKFLQQVARVDKVYFGQNDELNGPATATLDTPVLDITRLGEPVSAESRGAYRVSMAARNIFATIGDQEGCQVVDISPEGCAVISKKAMFVGTTSKVSFSYEGMVITGLLRVQSEKRLPNGALRYGLYAFEAKSAVRRSLERCSATLQRMQLKRFAGAA